MRAGLKLLRASGVEPVVIGAAMLQSDRWRRALSADGLEALDRVRGGFRTPMLVKGEEGLWRDVTTIPRRDRAPGRVVAEVADFGRRSRRPRLKAGGTFPAASRSRHANVTPPGETLPIAAPYLNCPRQGGPYDRQVHLPTRPLRRRREPWRRRPRRERTRRDERIMRIVAIILIATAPVRPGRYGCRQPLPPMALYTSFPSGNSYRCVPAPQIGGNWRSN